MNNILRFLIYGGADAQTTNNNIAHTEREQSIHYGNLYAMHQ